MKLAFLTPDIATLSAPVHCREIAIPGDLWQYVTGALLVLTKAQNWEQFGDATPEETAQFFENVFTDYLNSMCAYVGEIRSFVLSALPVGWLPLDGSIVSATSYPALAAVVPVSWLSGGNIIFPDMVSRSIIGKGLGYTLGDVGGEENHILTIAEMPAHDHSYELAVVNTDILGELPAPSINAITPSVTGSTGDGDTHNNMPPFLVVNWGIFSGVL